MNELQNYFYENHEVRVTEINGEPYFVGKDVAEVLGYRNSRKAIGDHVDSEDKGVTKCYTLGGEQDYVVINESGLYSLILSSKMPSAKRFKRWVTYEVLPSIRKHGAYATQATIDRIISDPDYGISLLKALKEERLKNAAQELQIEEMKPKATYCDMVLKSSSLVTTTIIAKDYGMSGSAFNKLLHELGIQYRQGGIWLLYAKYQDKGYTSTETFTYGKTESAVAENTGNTGNTGITRNTCNTGRTGIAGIEDIIRTKCLTKWTQKGRLFLYEKLKEEGILPMIEAEDQHKDS